MPDSVIKGVKEGFEEIGTEIGQEAKKAVIDIAADVPKQITDTDNNQNQEAVREEVKPPTDQDVVEHLYGVTNKPKLTKQQLANQQNQKAAADAQRKARLRQALRALNQKTAQKEPSITEKLAMEEQENKEALTQKRKRELPVLIQPTSLQKKGILGGQMGKKGRKTAIDLQTSTERRSTGGGIA